MQVKTLQEWIKQYEEKTNDKFNLPEGYNLMWLPERGFSISKIDPEQGILFIYETCGDGRFWFDVAKVQAGNLDMRCICTIVNRPLKAYIRGMGGEILHEWVRENSACPGVFQHRYLCQDNIGRKVICTHRCYNEETAIEEFWLTLYLYEKASLDEETLYELGKENNNGEEMAQHTSPTP